MKEKAIYKSDIEKIIDTSITKDFDTGFEIGVKTGRQEIFNYLNRYKIMLSHDEKIQIFGYDYKIEKLIEDFTPSEIIEKIEEYETKKISFGNIVEHKIYDVTGVITKVDKHIRKNYILWSDGSCDKYDFDDKNIRKLNIKRDVDLENLLYEIKIQE